MGHVNNAAYLDYLEETLHAAGPAARPAISGIPRRIRLEYLAPAAEGVVLLGETWRDRSDDRDGWAWRLTDDEGRELCIRPLAPPLPAAMIPEPMRRRGWADGALDPSAGIWY